jgi:hypothetical protein
MTIDALLARLEKRTVTSGTADRTSDVTPKPAPTQARTSVTSATAGNSVTVAEPIREASDPTAPGQTGDVDPLTDPLAEARRRRVLDLLATNPTARFALLTDTEADPEAVILTLAIRGRATCALRIPRAKYDPFLLLALIERHGETIH